MNKVFSDLKTEIQEVIENYEKNKQSELSQDKIIEKESKSVNTPKNQSGNKINYKTTEIQKGASLSKKTQNNTKDNARIEKHDSMPFSDAAEESICSNSESNDGLLTKDFDHPKEVLSDIKDDSMECRNKESRLYRSNRLIIGGLHIYFISVAREILEQNAIKIIPLMREYKLSENDINQIIYEMQESNVIDENKNPVMSLEEFERFIDIYEPGLFKCKNCEFDKKKFMDIGEVIFKEDVESVYDILPANEILDYLNIMENLKVISYDDHTNKYDILISKEDFYNICKSVPNFKKAERNTSKEINIDNMGGHDFEYYCADILRENGFENVEVTKGSRDHGIDILAEKNDITYAIQCKCYSADINNAAVQQAYTGKGFYKKDIAVVLTNRYFTAQAKEEAAALGVKLWDRDKLNSMIENGNRL